MEHFAKKFCSSLNSTLKWPFYGTIQFANFLMAASMPRRQIDN